ncbi:hypothetical protein ACQP31_02720 [Actinobacillus pleuropneumoniae]|uniref:hypothetical protein n=1 Tax=Actinobacillus pleuropneumoniae TaxID=715 RepID=UPI003D020CF8
MKKLVFLTIPFGLSACGSADLQTVWQDVSNLDKLFEPEQRKGVAVTKGYPVSDVAMNSTPQKTGKKVATKQSITHQRINTTQCKDADDWYLDGYRVGRSFASQKAAMYQQRVSYCKGMLSHADQFQQNWEKGFKVGVKKA